MSQAQTSSSLTGRKVLLMLVAFFGVVAGVNIVMMRQQASGVTARLGALPNPSHG